MHIRLLAALAVLAASLSACADLGIEMPKSADQIIKENEAKGPEVTGPDAEVFKQAQEAGERGEHEKAAQQYRQLLSRHPDTREYQLGLANSLRRAGKYPQANSIYDKILAADGNALGAKEGKALSLMASGDTVQAGKLLEQVIAADRTRWRALNAAGILFAMKSMPAEAEQYFKAALDAKPDNPTILNNMGLSYALDHDYFRAANTLQKGVAAAPDGTPDKKRLALNLALVYGLAGKMDEAEAAAKPYLSGPALYNNLGLYAALAKDKRMAKDYLNMALSKSPVYYEKAWKNLEALNQSGK